ncbi:MAG: iron-sulfur cluster assembly scaffold protein [Ferrovibrio sp.]|uniref:iron-sulfur cluster assembly scaffold protein n=1 Tax=Ferrovibrio sp. TaxID=1917215 RepID=UPI002620C71C|nr:iron-sulfur cluster assembly scaffold protein [Ferrovibrio sp.]MCW0232538.1 iron-sulfur cluster assembly scaffold protein [Ferrovibrio sp.]
MLNALYNEKILNFAAHIGQTERLAAPDATVTHHSPLCGSRITVDLTLAPDGRVAAYGQQVRACALGQAAASILGQHIVGQDAATLRQLVGVMRSMLKENGAPPGPDFAGGAFCDLEVLVPVREHKARHNAVLLPFEAAVKAIDQIEAARKPV